MPVRQKRKDQHPWIPIIMAMVAVMSLAATVYFGWQHQEGEKRLISVRLAMQFDDRFDSERMRANRRDLAKAILKGDDPPGDDVLDFFETVGFYARNDEIDMAVVYNDFSDTVLHYWPAVRDHVTRDRNSAGGSKDEYENFEWLNDALAREIVRRRHSDIKQVEPSAKEVKDFLQDESTLEAETTHTGSDGHRARPIRRGS